MQGRAAVRLIMLCKHLQQQELLRCKDCGGGEAEGTDRYLLPPCALASYDTAMIDPSLSLKILSSSGSKVLKSPKGLYCSHSLPVNPSDAIVPISELQQIHACHNRSQASYLYYC